MTTTQSEKPKPMSAPTQDASSYKTLLESTRAIPWKIDWATMTFAYVGPQIEELLGWTPASWKSAQDWVERMHPDDRAWVPDFCIGQSKAGVDHEADYRALKSDGSYVWIRDVVHVLRNEKGETEALVGFMFDISERKRTEEQLKELRHKLEDLSFKDGLTGVANRRRFDALFETEWRSARRTKKPLSLILIDIDFFKQFNDKYGHVRGDDCLRRVAQKLGAQGARPRDCVARYGGEEFVLLLPETDAEGAAHIAARCREALAEEKITHEASSVAKIVTLSIGAGTIVPGQDDDASKFLERVDQSLYQAKKQGRNTVVVAG